jgi:hypothetical protein
MTEQNDRPITPDPPRSPGTPEPPDLDVDVEQFGETRKAPENQDVTSDSALPEPPD